MITVSDIDAIEFTKSVRGYKDEEVDEFLEKVSATIAELNAKIETLNKETEVLKGNVAEWEKKYEDTLLKYGELENSLYTTLESAKTLMKEISESADKRANAIVANAQIDADNIMKKAKLDSENMLSDTMVRLRNLKNEENFLKEKVTTTKGIYTSFLRSEIRNIEKVDLEVFGERVFDEFDKGIAEEMNK